MHAQPSFDSLVPYLGRALGLSDDALVAACRPARESDLPGILALRQRVNGGHIWWNDEAFVRWRYFSGATAAGDNPYWVVSHGGETLGACGLEPITLVIDGTPHPAVRALDIMVDPRLNGLGLGAFINLMLFRRYPIILVTGSNDQSHHLLTRLYRHTTDLCVWKNVIRSRGVVDRKLNLGPLSGVFAAGADVLLSLRRSRRRLSLPRGVAVRELAGFDAQTTDLSRRCESAHRLMVRRGADYLNWRFVANTRCRHRVFGAFVGDRMDGYVVTRFNRARPDGGDEGEIVDWLVAPNEHGDAVQAALVQTAAGALAKSGAGLVSCAAVDPALERAMTANGFRFRPGERLPFFVRAADASLHARLSQGGDWFLTRADLDVE